MFGEIRSHSNYQAFVLEQLQTHHSGSSILRLVPSDWCVVKKFWLTDLSRTAQLLQSQYSHRGSKAKDPANLLRSYLLMLSVKQPSIFNGYHLYMLMAADSAFMIFYPNLHRGSRHDSIPYSSA